MATDSAARKEEKFKKQRTLLLAGHYAQVKGDAKKPSKEVRKKKPISSTSDPSLVKKKT